MATPPDPIALPGLEPVADGLAERYWTAFRDKGDAYEPRTHHLRDSGKPEYINRLIFETSPYLLQHAHNPVDWHPWAPETFDKAAALDRPVLLSVGYSTCHWCHVMERESFEDVEIAAFINQNFVAIKVDREERPDVDSVYMTVVQLMTGGGGWPMTVVMLPDGRPYFGGTYFPARSGDRGARVGFVDILQRLVEVYRQEHDKVLSSATSVSRALQQSAQREVPEALPSGEALAKGAQWAAKRFDAVFGGIGGPPKFPTPARYELLLRYARRARDPGALHIVTHSVRAMADGGIYDHVGGGFARYSTDARWLVPHFEKMLYDNAQMLRLLIETGQACGDRRFFEVASDVADYVLREMLDDEGAFFSATDADSEGEEGKFFVWTPEEIREVLEPEQARLVMSFYGVTERGNFDGKNIFHRSQSIEAFSAAANLEPATVKGVLQEARRKLYAARAQRIPPLLDDKILTEWNAQMISGLALAGFALSVDRYIETAVKAAEFIESNLVRDGRLLRSYRSGEAKHTAVLEDHAFLVDAHLTLFETTGDRRWLDRALHHQAVQDRHFWDADGGGYFATADDAEALLVREKAFYDGAQPAGNSVAALNLLRIYQLTDQFNALERAERTLLAAGEPLAHGAIENPKMGQALDFYLDEPLQIVVAEGSHDDPTIARELWNVLRRTFVPNRVLVRVGQATNPGLPITEGKVARDDRTTVYVCKSQVCERPTSDPEVLGELLKSFVPMDVAPIQVEGVP
ncbi:MAG: thioredoxin domain-containing protein [Myxococcota bacterium]